jgi:hypothetical protein
VMAGLWDRLLAAWWAENWASVMAVQLGFLRVVK